MNTFKICLVGPARSGKTTYIYKLLNATMPEEYTPTLGVDVHPIRVVYDGLEARVDRSIEGKKICFNVWDCSGSFPGLREGYYMQAQGAIVMVESIEGDIEKHNLNVCIEELKQYSGNEGIKIVMVVSKSDVGLDEWIGGYRVYRMNCLTNMGLMEPLTYLAGELA